MNIGEKLRRLRLQRNLTQEEMADRCELSKGFISQVERDLASPSIATLTDMLECLGSNLKEFFSETETEEKIVFARGDMFVKEDADFLRGSITWLVPSAQKNEMEPIINGKCRRSMSSFAKWIRSAVFLLPQQIMSVL